VKTFKIVYDIETSHQRCIVCLYLL